MYKKVEFLIQRGSTLNISRHRVQHIKTTDHPEYPLRNVLLCKDASIRVVSPVSGDILTSLLMPPKRKLIDAAYAVAEGLKDIGILTNT